MSSPYGVHIGALPHHPSFRDGQELYHYTTLGAALAIIANERLWLTEFGKLNDEQEYLYAEGKFLTGLQEMSGQFDTPSGMLARIALATMKLQTLMLVGSLTDRRDDLVQWRLYADEAQGCVLGIDAQFLEQYAGVAVRKVRYRPAELKQFVRTGLQMLHEQMSNGDPDSDASTLAKYFVTDLFAFKHPRFSAEREIRISRLLLTDTDAPTGIRDGGGVNVLGEDVPAQPVRTRVTARYGEARYIELPINGAIRSVGVGPRGTQEALDALRAATVGRPSKIRVWKSRIPYR